MALSSETDPVQTIIDLLNNTADSDYTSSKPSIIEKMEETGRRLKLQQSENALYVWRPSDADRTQFSAKAAAYSEQHVVQVEVWTPTSSSKAWEVSKDLVDYIWTNYGADNRVQSNWHRIQPVTGVEFRHEASADQATQYRAGFQLRLTDVRDT